MLNVHLLRGVYGVGPAERTREIVRKILAWRDAILFLPCTPLADKTATDKSFL